MVSLISNDFDCFSSWLLSCMALLWLSTALATLSSLATFLLFNWI